MQELGLELDALHQAERRLLEIDEAEPGDANQDDLSFKRLRIEARVEDIGRGLEYYDGPKIEKIVAALEKDNYRFSTLVIEIVKSDAFRMRRGKGQ